MCFYLCDAEWVTWMLRKRFSSELTQCVGLTVENKTKKINVQISSTSVMSNYGFSYGYRYSVYPERGTQYRNTLNDTRGTRRYEAPLATV